MKITDCTWEKENIGSNVLEIDIERGDNHIIDIIASKNDEYDYIVVKVPVNMTAFNWELGQQGFTMIETQMKYSISFKDLNCKDPYMRSVLPNVTFKEVVTAKDLNDILDNITSDMFVTDRISLDPMYGTEKGCHRYKNYIANSYKQHSAEIIQTLFKEQNVGFEMFVVKDGICFGKLGGIYKNVQVPGLGLLTTCTPLLYTHDKYGVNKFIPDVSSNNIPVVRLYNYIHAKLESLTYVFVKHYDEHAKLQ